MTDNGVDASALGVVTRPLGGHGLAAGTLALKMVVFWRRLEGLVGMSEACHRALAVERVRRQQGLGHRQAGAVAPRRAVAILLANGGCGYRRFDPPFSLGRPTWLLLL